MLYGHGEETTSHNLISCDFIWSLGCYCFSNRNLAFSPTESLEDWLMARNHPILNNESLEVWSAMSHAWLWGVWQARTRRPIVLKGEMADLDGIWCSIARCIFSWTCVSRRVLDSLY